MEALRRIVVADILIHRSKDKESLLQYMLETFGNVERSDTGIFMALCEIADAIREQTEVLKSQQYNKT